MDPNSVGTNKKTLGASCVTSTSDMELWKWNKRKPFEKLWSEKSDCMENSEEREMKM